MADRTLAINLTANDAQALAALKRLQSGLGGVDKSLDHTRSKGLSLGTALGGLAIGAGIRKAVGEYEEAEQQLASTEAVIRSTGNAAEVSAEQQAQLVEQLSRLAGVDDEVVNGGANMLRTFTEIKGANFGQALAASLDMAAFKGQDLASTAELIGKALNDPVAGMTKLTRAGVVLSDQQKQQIRDFAAVGDVASAQGVILAELEKEYGGQAEAMATSSGRMKVAIDDAAESVGQALAPAITAAAGATTGLVTAFTDLPAPVQTAALLLGGIGLAARKIESGISDAGGSLSTFGDDLSRVDKGLTVAAAGMAAFTAATALLNEISDTDVNLSDLAKDLEQLGSGAADTSDVLDTMNVNIDELADAWKKASDVADDSAWDTAYKALTGEKFGAEFRQAQERTKELDEALAGLVESGNPEAAKTAFDEIAAALQGQGISMEDIIEQLPDYADAQYRAARAANEGKDKTEEQAASIEDLTKVGNTQIEAAMDLADAQESYSDAQRNTKEAQDDLAEAQRAALGDSDEYRRALEDIADAQKAEEDAARDVQRAQEDLTQARKDAAESIEDLRFAAEGSALSEERARLRLEDAQANKRKVDKDPKATEREKKEAALELAEAELALREAQDRRQDSADALIEADRKGVEGSDQVVAAKEGVAAALDRQADAEKRTKEATNDAAQVIEDAKKRVDEASERVEDAIRNEAKAHRDVAKRIYGTAAANEVYIETLRKHAEHLDPNSPLRKALDSYIEDLERLAAIDDQPKSGNGANGGGFQEPGGSYGIGPFSGSGKSESWGPTAPSWMTPGGDARPGVSVTINAPGMVVGGTPRDLEKAAAQAGRDVARQIKVAA